MNCRRVEELISLFVENDLGESESQAVSLHLASCESCGALLNQYRDSQTWMRSQATTEFSDDFFDEIRRSVLANIEEKPRANWVQMIIERLRPYPLMAATAALLVLVGAVALYAYLGKEAASPNSKQVAGAPGQPDQQDEETAPDNEENTRESKEPENQYKRLPRPRRHPAAVARKQKSDEILPQPVGGPGMVSRDLRSGSTENADIKKKMEGMTRIEIHTKDPNIRIIWFAPKSDDSRSSRPVTD